MSAEPEQLAWLPGQRVLPRTAEPWDALEESAELELRRSVC